MGGASSTISWNQQLCSISNNAGTARSQGIEFELNYAVTSDLLMNFGGAYIEAEVTEDEANPQLVGTNLSNAPLVTATIGGEYSFELGAYPAFVRADVNYVGEYYTTHGEAGLQAGDYVNVDFRAGLNVDQWSLALYVKNLSNNNAAVKSFFRMVVCRHYLYHVKLGWNLITAFKFSL